MSAMITEADWHDTAPWIDRPDADIDAYVRTLPAEERDWARQHLLAWRRDGIVVLPKAVSDSTIDALLNDIEHLISNHRDYELPVELSGRQHPRIAEVSESSLRDPGTKFNNLHQISAAAVSASLNAPTMRFLRHVFADRPALLQSLTFFRGSQQPVHVDFPYVRNQIRIAQLAASWIALEDIEPDAGPLAYWLGAHHPQRLGFFDWGDGSIVHEPTSTRHPFELCTYLQRRIEGMSIPKSVFLPRRGDALIWHGMMPHEGTPIVNPNLTRKSYVTHYTAREAYPVHFMKPNALADGLLTEMNGGVYYQYGWLDSPRQLPSGSASLGSDAA